MTTQINIQTRSLNQNLNLGITQNSFIPTLTEMERFIQFLIKMFNFEDVKEINDYVLTINKAHKNTLGYFMPKEHQESFVNTTKKLNNINLNTYHLKTHNPYEILTHEFTHFINQLKGIKDCSINQYHNLKFKAQAEKFYLKVEKMNNKGYAHTEITPLFNEMMTEFKPHQEVFNIAQTIGEKKQGKSKTKMKKWFCGCGMIVRCARELNATCDDCYTKFEVEL